MANKYRLDEINKIRDYFNNEIKERKDIIKKLNKYLVSFDYLDKIFITLSASFGTLSIASYASVVGIPADITGASLTLVFTIGTGISKSLLKLTKKRKKKHNKIIVLAKNKLNTIDTLLSSSLNDSERSHEEFTNIINEQNICDCKLFLMIKIITCVCNYMHFIKDGKRNLLFSMQKIY